ncbi:MAG TPA: hypothetical protein V6D47_04355, partial [Oscillatoriaceae cyanobacterium]
MNHQQPAPLLEFASLHRARVSGKWRPGSGLVSHDPSVAGKVVENGVGFASSVSGPLFGDRFL